MPDVAVITSMGVNGIQYYNPADNSLSSKMLPSEFQCEGYRSFAVDGYDLYVCGAFSSRVRKYNFVSKQIKTLCNCVGKYPIKILSWEDYIVIACNETDTVEICRKSGGQSIISHKLGGLLNGMTIINDKCYAISAQEESVYILSLPELHLLDSFELGFIPNGINEMDGNLLVYGSERYENGRLAVYTAEGILIHACDTAFSPVDALVMKKYIILSCAGENLLCIHDKNDLKIVRIIKLDDVPDRLCVAGNKLIIGMHLSGRIKIVDMKNRGLQKNLEVFKEPSEISVLTVH